MVRWLAGLAVTMVTYAIAIKINSIWWAFMLGMTAETIIYSMNR